jgi:uncharacterized damage-inducible protein DinB
MDSKAYGLRDTSMNIAQLQRLFRYECWANMEALNGLKVIAAPPPKTIQILVHIVGAQKLWLARLQTQPQSMAVWPDLTIAQCEQHLAALAEAWQQYLHNLTTEQFTQHREYKNSKGEVWVNTVADILLHVLMHSSYHRGQIALELSANGYPPANTDFIHAVREGFIP